MPLVCKLMHDILKTMIFEEKMISFLFFSKMDEAWPNAPSSTINVNFEKSYYVKTSVKKNLIRTRSKSQNWAKQGLLE